MQYLLTTLIELLNPNNTLSFNRFLAHGIGLVETIVYAALIGKQTYYCENGMLYEDGWFYSTIYDLQESTTLGEKAQRTAIKHLVGHGLIECEKKGMPAKRFFRIIDDNEKVLELVECGRKISESIMEKSRENSPETVITGQKNSPQPVEKSESDGGKNIENDVKSSYRPSAATSDRPGQTESKANITQRNKKIDDRSINQSAENENFENPQAVENVESVGVIETVESQYSPESFAQVLDDIGIDWYDFTANEPLSEDSLCELDEGLRKTRKCKIPYYLKQSPKAVEMALKYIFAFSYYATPEYPEHAEFCRSVIDCLGEMITADSHKIAGEKVMYYQVIDRLNDVVRSYSLPDWLNSFKDKWNKILRQTSIANPRRYMKSCIWNWLRDWKIEEYNDLNSFDDFTGGY